MYSVADISLNIMTYWEDLFNTPVPWTLIFKLIYNTTICTRMRFFQYRLIYKFLPTNRMLHIWKLIDSPFCSYCEVELETTTHALWDCPKVYELWKEIKEWFEQQTSEILPIDIFSVIFGDINSSILKNVIILVAKCFIFNLRGKRLFLGHYISYLKSHYKTDLIIATRNNKLETHYNKWGPIMHKLN